MSHQANDRAALAFPEVVCSEFDFLIKNRFRCVRIEPTFVRYESDKIFINVYHGRTSYELGLEVGPLMTAVEPDLGYSFSALLSLAAPPEAATYRNFIAKTPTALKTGVLLLREKFQACGWEILRADPDIFVKLKAQRAQSSEAFAMEVRARQVRPKAEAAFRRKNYEEALRLYDSIRSNLSAVELKKLEYARKHRS